MCYERWQRRHRDAEDSWSVWQDFERTRPVADPEPAEQDVPPEPAEAEQEIAVSER
jgi:hypothetical protein